jgi:hypothetical protein
MGSTLRPVAHGSRSLRPLQPRERLAALLSQPRIDESDGRGWRVALLRARLQCLRNLERLRPCGRSPPGSTPGAQLHSAASGKLDGLLQLGESLAVRFLLDEGQPGPQ